MLDRYLQTLRQISKTLAWSFCSNLLIVKAVALVLGTTPPGATRSLSSLVMEGRTGTAEKEGERERHDPQRTAMHLAQVLRTDIRAWLH